MTFRAAGVALSIATAFACGAGWIAAAQAQHAYEVGPPNPYLEANPMGPPRNESDADRFCIGSFNVETPYAINTCYPPLSDQFTMTLALGPDRPAAANAIARPTDVPKAIAACWSPPSPPGGETWQATLRIVFAADGRVVGKPRIAYISAPDAATRSRLRASLAEALPRCGKFRFTVALGRAIAGRLFAIRFILRGRG
ncbi:MAG: hypothetical protein U1E30_18095 [Rhodoblastus sp.]